MKGIVSSALVLTAISTFSLTAMTLNDALSDGLRTNPEILERLKNYDKTVYDLKIAKSEYAPSIDFISRFGYEKTYDKHTTAGFQEVGYHIYQNSLTLTQNLFNGFSTKYRVKYEKARVMAAAFNYVEKTNDVAFNIVKEYINVLKYADLYKLEKENITLTQDILNKTKELSDAGSGPLSDVKKVDSSLQLAEFNFLTQENNLMDSKFNLGKLLGKRIEHSKLVAPEFNFKLPATMADANNHAITYNPSMIVTNYNIETAKAALVQARSKFSPTVDFELQYNFDKNTGAEEGHSRSYSALIVYKHNLYRGNADKNDVRKNKLNIMQEYEIQREIRRQIIEGLQLSWSAYTMIEKQLQFLNSYKEESKATLDLYREEFEDGSRTLIDLLTAQDDYISSRSKYITASYDWLFAKYRILDSMGELINALFQESAGDFYKPTTANYKRVSSYKLPISEDRDGDKVADKVDLCDNTALGFEVNMYGCAKDKEEVVDMVPTNTINLEGQKKTFKDEFLGAKRGFTLNLATFSTQNEVDRFINASNLEDGYMTFTYLNKSNKKLYKIVSGVYEDRKTAYKALKKLPRIVKVNKPYLDNLNNVKNLYNKYN